MNRDESIRSSWLVDVRFISGAREGRANERLSQTSYKRTLDQQELSGSSYSTRKGLSVVKKIKKNISR